VSRLEVIHNNIILNFFQVLRVLG